MLELKQNATDKLIPFPIVLSSDHINGATGLTPSVEISKNGGAFAAPAGTVAEVGYGVYALTPDSADTDTLGPLSLHAGSAGADPYDKECVVVNFDPYDPASLGLTNLDAAVTSRSAPGDAMTLDFTQAVPTSNTSQTVGDALNAGLAMAFGKWTLVGTTLTLYAADEVTVVKTFTLDSGTDPTTRT